MSSFSFLILLMWILSLCHVVSLAKGLSTLLIFSKNQILDLLILYIVLLISTSLISSLNLIISCCLLLLGIFNSFLSRAFRWAVKLIDYYLSTLWKHSELWDFLLALLSFYSKIWIGHAFIFIEFQKIFFFSVFSDQGIIEYHP